MSTPKGTTYEVKMWADAHDVDGDLFPEPGKSMYNKDVGFYKSLGGALKGIDRIRHNDRLAGIVTLWDGVAVFEVWAHRAGFKRLVATVEPYRGKEDEWVSESTREKLEGFRA